MERWIGLPSLTLQLVCGGLFLSPVGCTSQTAIAIVAIGADASTRDSVSAGPDTTADIVVGYADAFARDSIASGGADAIPDAQARQDAYPLLPETSSPETAGHDTAPEVASVRDTPPPGPVTLFADGFDGGYEVNWLLSESSDGPVTNARDGDNAIVTLDASQTDYTRIRCNLSGDLFAATNITASMRLRIEDPPSSTRTVRLDVRQSAATANVFYAVGAVVAKDGTITQVSIFKKVPDGLGNYTICEVASGEPFATPIAMNAWRRIKLTISGTTSVHLAAFFEDLQVATFNDDCTSTLLATNGVPVANGGCLSDQTALGIQVEKGLIASVDDVLVTTP
jgi:hypothetical protein